MSMAALQADPAPFGCHIRCDQTRPGPASHDDEGRRFVLIAPTDTRFLYALDVETRNHPAPDALARALGPQAMARWGEIEVIAKLLGQPAHLVTRQVLALGMPTLIRYSGVQVARCDTPALWQVIGRLPAF